MQQKKIIFADDEEDILNVLSGKLRKNNYFVVALAKGKDVIDSCKINKPDLILLDIAMPDIDGYAVASALREDKVTRAIPIIFLTGKELKPEGVFERIEQLGACDYMVKPFSFESLLTKIKETIG
jgi:twitching motility two-component system response regulator PilH